jgi:S1-C subfamily serine protease
MPYTVIDPETGAVHRREDVVVREIVASSAASGKIFVDDIIVSLSANGETVMAHRVHNIIDFMLGIRVGDTITVTLIRDGKEMTVDITLTENSVSDIA